MSSQETLTRPDRAAPPTGPHPVDAVPPLHELLVFGVQHLAIMYAGAVAVPLIVGPAVPRRRRPWPQCPVTMDRGSSPPNWTHAPGGGVAAVDVAPDDELRDRLRSCCAAEAWVEEMMAGRPYRSEAALYAASDRATAALDARGLEQALAGHPRIGDTASGHGGDGRSAAWSRGEQAGVAAAGTDVPAELASANAAYEQRFGHVYLVCASGRGAAELLVVCRARLDNDPDTERGVVLEELAKINRLRLGKLLEGR